MLLAHTPKTGRGTGVSTEEKLDGTKKRGEEKRKKNGRRWESVLGKSDVTPRALQSEIYSVMFLSDSKQFGQKVTLRVKTYLKL